MAAATIINLKKSEFFKQTIQFLGHTLQISGTSPELAKVKAVQDWPQPFNLTTLRSFLGFIGYYQKFIKNFAFIAEPLTRLLKKEIPFLWETEQQKAFQLLKQCLSSAPILTPPDYSKDFFLETDASALGIGAVLYQKYDLDNKPIAFYSRKLQKAESNYPAHELEMLAIHDTLAYFRHYVEGKHVTILTDHASLQYFFKKNLLNRKMTRWISYLEEFETTIKYKPGRENIVAEALSRKYVEEEFNFIDEYPFYNATFSYLSTGEWSTDMEESLKQRVLVNRKSFKVDNGNLYKKIDNNWLLVLPIVLRADAITKAHHSLAHRGADAVFDYLKSRCWFPQMREFVRETVSTCIECQKCAPVSSHPSEELHRLPPVKTFQRWSLDFMGPLPVTRNGFKWLLVAIEHATKWPIVKPLRCATAEEVATFLYEEIVLKFGCPGEILTDRGSQFMGNLLKEYLCILQTKHLKTSAYHPRTNGMVERLNGTIKSAFSKMVQDNPTS